MIFSTITRCGMCLAGFAPGLFLAGMLSAAADNANVTTLADVDTITIMPIVFPAAQTDEDRKEKFESLYGKLDDYAQRSARSAVER